MLSQVEVPEALWDKLGEKKVTSAALFGSMASTEDKIHDYMKRVLKVDPDADEDHFLVRGQLTMVWES